MFVVLSYEQKTEWCVCVCVCMCVCVQCLGDTRLTWVYFKKVNQALLPMVGFPSTGKRQNKRNLFKIGGEARSTVYVGNTGSPNSGDGTGQAAADSTPPPPHFPQRPLGSGHDVAARHHDTGSDPENLVRGSPGYKRGVGVSASYRSIDLLSVRFARARIDQSCTNNSYRSVLH